VGNFYVYILSSKSRVLYTGMTDDICRGTREHRNVNPALRDYKVLRLVYYKTFKDVNNAIARENRSNSAWDDLSESWFDRKQILRFALDDKVFIEGTNN
jgi:putative endonuclease